MTCPCPCPLQCKATISQLRLEVQSLEQEKERAELAADSNKKTLVSKKVSQAEEIENERAASLLREKIRLLDAKQKELRKKEVEYAKLLQLKEQACREVSLPNLIIFNFL